VAPLSVLLSKFISIRLPSDVKTAELTLGGAGTGRNVGLPVGTFVASISVGDFVFCTLGRGEGLSDGNNEGLRLGFKVGVTEGKLVGILVGTKDGIKLGALLGSKLGNSVGNTEGKNDGIMLG
jgi:hypothetical protein